MATNVFFNHAVNSEQHLYEDLVVESLRMYGHETMYLPRQVIEEDSILNEDVQSKFGDAYSVEMYIENTDGFEGEGDLMSKFGLQIRDQATFVISLRSWERFISLDSNLATSFRPNEGDLIYFPFGDRLFEIKYVEHEKPFYMLKNTYVYELRCELFRYEDEVIDTGVDEIDDTLEATEGVDGADFVIGTTQKLTLVGDAVQATAETTQVHGGIQFVTVTNRGSGYKFAPRVAISSAPAGGVTGIATASLLGGLYIGAGYDAASNTSVVQEVNLVNPGSGYTTGP